jgi:nucleoside-diphosphate-sugar epimerase
MKVLLTGASGLVGSHVLDHLLQKGVAPRLLLRANSSTRFLEQSLARAEVCRGAVDDPACLAVALQGITHVIHCAGATKALNREGYFQVNYAGTVNLLEAVRRHAPGLQRFVHISSLAASGPATATRPAREADAPCPLTDYGASKLAGEQAVRERCAAPYVIIRPPGVYGPRDGEFLKLFKAIGSHLLPRFGFGRQELSLVYAPDLAAAIVHCLEHPGAVGQTFNVAHPEVVSVRQLGDDAARLLNTWALPLALPNAALWPVCALQELVCRITRRPNVVNLQKYRELAAPGWVCEVSRLRERTGFAAPTGLGQGLAATLAWYRENQWL